MWGINTDNRPIPWTILCNLKASKIKTMFRLTKLQWRQLQQQKHTQQQTLVMIKHNYYPSVQLLLWTPELYSKIKWVNHVDFKRATKVPNITSKQPCEAGCSYCNCRVSCHKIPYSGCLGMKSYFNVILPNSNLRLGNWLYNVNKCIIKRNKVIYEGTGYSTRSRTTRLYSQS